jgi:hypothetical protein
LRLEIEQAVGLKFPIKNGEAMIQFEESMEIPRSAELLMKGMYHNPEEVKHGFQTLQQETANLLEILLPRRSRFREWVEQLPEHPREAEKFLKETSEQMQRQDQRMLQIEKELLTKLEESGMQDLFPIPVSAFAQMNLNEPSVKLYLRPLGRLAEIFQINPEHLRNVVRLHYLVQLLLVEGLDLDGQVCQRKNDEKVLVKLTCFFTLRQIQGQSEVVHCYGEWVKSWGGVGLLEAFPQQNSIEKIRAAMVFWRRRTTLTWDEVWDKIKSLDSEGFSDCRYSESIREHKFYN